MKKTILSAVCICAGIITLSSCGGEKETLKEKINKILAGISEDERKDLMDEAIKNQPASK